MANKYRKKPVVVEAVQFFEKDFIINNTKFTGFPIQDMAMLSEIWLEKGVSDGRYFIRTLEGDMGISEGDYIIRGVQGEYYPCKPNIFEQTYEKVV